MICSTHMHRICARHVPDIVCCILFCHHERKRWCREPEGAPTLIAASLIPFGGVKGARRLIGGRRRDSPQRDGTEADDVRTHGTVDTGEGRT